MEAADAGTAIVLALIGAGATIGVALIGLVATRRREVMDRRDTPRGSDDDLATEWINDLRRDRARLLKENQRLLNLLEERGWSD